MADMAKPGPKTELAVTLRGGLLATADAVLLQGPGVVFHMPKTRRKVWISDRFQQQHATLYNMVVRLATFWTIIAQDEYARLLAGRHRGAELLALVTNDELEEASCFVGLCGALSSL